MEFPEFKIDSNLIMPLGIVMFFCIIFSSLIGEDKSANQFILGIALMYFSWLAVYLIQIKPHFTELCEKLNKLTKVKEKK